MQGKSRESQKKQSLLKQRLREVESRLEKLKLDSFLVSSQSNRHYLGGWQGDRESGFLLITANKSLILTDSRYTEHAVSSTSGFSVLEYSSSFPLFFSDLLKEKKLKRVGFESHDLPVVFAQRIKKFAKGVKFRPIAHLIEDVRSTKDDFEIKKLEAAAGLSGKAFEHILKFIKPGISEKEVAWEMEKFLREKGAERIAWNPFIVAAGANSSMAHWGASNTKIKKGDMIQLDYGCIVDGYNSDISRVVFVGESSGEQKKIYDLVHRAQNLGINLMRPGRKGATIDDKVRNFLRQETKYVYQHAIGHGIGLQVHELPFVSSMRTNKLVQGNVITIEPGVYIPGWGGVRIEDMILVTEKGNRVLTKAPKSLNEVTI